MSENKLSQDELEQRVKVVKRFKELLTRQRNKFKEYMALLDYQKNDIENGNIDALVQHVEIEQNMVNEIFAVQKAIVPLEDMYRTSCVNDELNEISSLKSTLNNLSKEVAVRNAENQVLLKERMGIIRSEMMRINNPYTKKRSVYMQAAEPRMLNIPV